MPYQFEDPILNSNIENLILDIKRGVVIPIVGYDLLYYDEKDPFDDFLKQLIKIHTQDKDLESKYTNESQKRLTGFELLNAYYHNLPNNQKPNFKTSISKTIKKERTNLQLTPDSFRKLVSIKHFEFFINATITNSLEIAYNTFRGEGSDELAIKSSYDIIKYSTIGQNDLKQAPPAPKNFEIKFQKPLIYNLFGTHDDRAIDYLLTDADYIELIHDIIKDNDLKFNALLTYLNRANLLFLGCNFPDWFFRFFIRICVGDRLDSVSQIERKAVIDSLNNIDSSRTVFINQYKIQTIPIDCNVLIDEIYRVFRQDNETSDILGESGNGIIFISYCRGDEDIAKSVANQFDKKYIEYFLDCNDLNIGDNLNDKITDAINKCCLFMPVVSNNIPLSSGYIWKEVAHAIGQNKNIWPIFKEFVDRDMLISEKYAVTSQMRDAVLNKNMTKGIDWGKGNSIPDLELGAIKEVQYKYRVKPVIEADTRSTI